MKKSKSKNRKRKGDKNKLIWILMAAAAAAPRRILRLINALNGSIVLLQLLQRSIQLNRL